MFRNLMESVLKLFWVGFEVIVFRKVFVGFVDVGLKGFVGV